MSRLLIGLPRLTGKHANYAKRFGMVEVRAESLPERSWRRWRAEVAPPFAFSLVLPKTVAELRDDRESAAALERALKAVQALEASCIVLLTPASVRPTKPNREQIVALAARLPRGGQLLAWEPSGLWTLDEISAVAQEGGWLPVGDAGEQALPGGPMVYTRIRALGKAARMGPSRIARIADQLVGRREAYVVADPPVASKLASMLPAAISRLGVQNGVPQLFRPTPSLELDMHDEEQ